jgi:membrane fusion protein (multidrug efflux system)
MAMDRALVSRYQRWLWAIILVVVMIAGFWRYTELFPSTTNAYVEANLLTVSSEIVGRLHSLPIKNHQSVKKGQLLLSLDPTAYQAALESSQDIQGFAQLQMKMVEAPDHKKLTAEKFAKIGMAEVQNLQAQAVVDRAKYALANTKLYAPMDGVVENLSLHTGNIIAAGVPLFSIVDDSQWWIEANFKETQLHRIKPGQKVDVQLDMYGGVVESIAIGSGSVFSLFPPENASGNWVKVTQRFPVRIRLNNNDKQYPLRVGASATVTIDTSKGISSWWQS